MTGREITPSSFCEFDGKVAHFFVNCEVKEVEQKDFLENIERIQSKLCHRDLYEMLAEEAAELSQAALKVIRAEGMSGSVTPITAEEAHANLNEEVVDVLVVLAALNVEIFNAKLAEEKVQRWADRLRF